MISHRGRALAVWCAVFTFLSLLSLSMRMLALRKQRRAFRDDDYLVIFATINMTALVGCCCWAIHNGLGFHVTELTIPQLSVQFKLEFAGNVTWTLSTVCCKLAVLRFYLFVFPNNKTFKKAVWVVFVSTVLYGVVLIPVFIGACNPVSASWDPLQHEAKCWPWMYHSLAALSLNVLLDVTIVAMPLPVVWGVQMPTKKKIGVSAMFSLGLSIVAIMLWRLTTTVQALDKAPDFSYDLYVVAVQSLLELWLGLIATNFPTIAPLFPKLVPPRVKQYFLSSGSSRNKGGPRVSLRTFGSSGRNPKLQDFDRLSDDNQELEHLGKNKISRRRDIEVSVERSSDGDMSKKPTADMYHVV
jgi:hypothetical protein